MTEASEVKGDELGKDEFCRDDEGTIGIEEDRRRTLDIDDIISGLCERKRTIWDLFDDGYERDTLYDGESDRVRRRSRGILLPPIFETPWVGHEEKDVLEYIISCS